MRGATVKRGKRWSAVYDERDKNGNRKQRWRGGFATQREAQTFLNSVLPKIADGSYVAPSQLTLEQFLVEEWLPAIRGKRRPLTVTTYASAVRNRIVPRIGHLKLQGLSPGHLNAFYSELEREGLSVSSRRLTHAVLSSALKDAVRWEKTSRNVAVAADRAVAYAAGRSAAGGVRPDPKLGRLRTGRDVPQPASCPTPRKDEDG